AFRGAHPGSDRQDRALSGRALRLLVLAGVAGLAARPGAPPAADLARGHGAGQRHRRPRRGRRARHARLARGSAITAAGGGPVGAPPALAAVFLGDGGQRAEDVAALLCGFIGEARRTIAMAVYDLVLEGAAEQMLHD